MKHWMVMLVAKNGVRRGCGLCATREEATAKCAAYAANLKACGLDHVRYEVEYQ